MTEDQWVQSFVTRMRELNGPEEDTNIIYLLASSAYLVMRDTPPDEAAEQQRGVDR